jgi:hypothetical protein
MDFDYEKLLENPLWKAKRKRIILRDGKKCTVCGSTTRLQVHHTYYYKQPTEPWRYPDESLLTVCKDCHQNHHEHSENEYRDKPKPITRKKHIKKKPIKKHKAKQQKNNPSYPNYQGHKKLSLAYIQANRSNFRKLENGDWVAWNYNEEKYNEQLKKRKKY